MRQDDSKNIQTLFPHWEIVKHLSDRIPWPYPKDGATEYVRMILERISASRDEVWAITERGNDQLIGVMEYLADDTDGSGNRGFWLGLPWHGKGYMTEAVAAFHDYAFGKLHLERLIFCNAINNPASRRIKEKTGATLLGTIDFPHLDGTRETQRWELTAEAWVNRPRLPSPETP